MTKCKCGNKLSRGNIGGACKSCYYNRNKSDGEIANDDDSPEIINESLLMSSQTVGDYPVINDEDYENAISKNLGIDLNKSLSDLSVRDLIFIIREQYNPLRNAFVGIQDKLNTWEVKMTRITDENADNAKKLKSSIGEVECLKKVILEQQKYLETVKRKENAKNIIISGIPNGKLDINENTSVTDGKEKIDAIFEYIGCTDQLGDDYHTINIPPAPGKNSYSIKLCLKDDKTVKHILDNAKSLKDFKAAAIYINYDEPYYTRRENNRLRKKKYTLTNLHKDDVIQIQKGKLYHNNLVIDKFDLANQIF